jgi:hypothetical protein
MPKITKAEAPILISDEHLDGRYAELGPFTVAFERFHIDADPAPLFRGLPEDRCQCEHWGMVRSGKVVFRLADHDEEFSAGDFYYAPPGHLPLGSEVAEFSPTAALAKTMAVLQAKHGGGRSRTMITNAPMERESGPNSLQGASAEPTVPEATLRVLNRKFIEFLETGKDSRGSLC